jgi:hypothetical protein
VIRAVGGKEYLSQLIVTYFVQKRLMHLRIEFHCSIPTASFVSKTITKYFYQPLSKIIIIIIIMISYYYYYYYSQPIPVVARSKAWVCGRWLAGIAGSNPAEGMEVYLL